MEEREQRQEDFAAQGEVYDFLAELSKRKYSGIIEIQFKRGEARRWAKLSRFRRMGGDNGK